MPALPSSDAAGLGKCFPVTGARESGREDGALKMEPRWPTLAKDCQQEGPNIYVRTSCKQPGKQGPHDYNTPALEGSVLGLS